MIAQIVTENGVKKIKPLTADIGAGNPVGTIVPMYKKSNPSGYLYCDGSTFDETAYPLLYAYLGSNVLPDYREFALVGAEQNTTDTIASHDVYAQGEGKDDQFQTHQHGFIYVQSSGSSYDGITGGSAATQQIQYTDRFRPSQPYRYGDVTRGKRKAVYFYIKATSGLPENQQDNVLATINANNSYSTTEHATGKKWIDGKPIYRIVLTTTANISGGDVSFGGLQTDIANLNIDTVIKADGIDNNNRISYRTLYFSSTSGFGPYSSGMLAGSKIILEYTKTTD